MGIHYLWQRVNVTVRTCVCRSLSGFGRMCANTCYNIKVIRSLQKTALFLHRPIYSSVATSSDELTRNDG